MRRLRDLEGYLMLDHRHADPVSDELTHKVGLPVGAGRGLFEVPTFTCSHCGKVVIVIRSSMQEQDYCGGCDHYICKKCAAIKSVTLQCKTLAQVMDELEAKLLRAATP